MDGISRGFGFGVDVGVDGAGAGAGDSSVGDCFRLRVRGCDEEAAAGVEGVLMGVDVGTGSIGVDVGTGSIGLGEGILEDDAVGMIGVVESGVDV